MTRTLTAPKCTTCKTREASYDGESDSYFSQCDTCSLRHVPHCIETGCLLYGHTHRRAVVVNPKLPREQNDAVRFRCESCGFEGTGIEWQTKIGTDSANGDMEALEAGRVEQWLIDTRVQHALADLIADANRPADAPSWHRASPLRLASQRAYVATAVASHTCGGEDDRTAGQRTDGCVRCQQRLHTR